MAKTILIIEDEIAIQNILAEPLRACGYKVNDRIGWSGGYQYFSYPPHRPYPFGYYVTENQRICCLRNDTTRSTDPDYPFDCP